MEQDQPPSHNQQDNTRKHESSIKSSTTVCNTRGSPRSGDHDLLSSTPTSLACPSEKGSSVHASSWNVNSSDQPIPISLLPPKKRYLRRLQLNQASEVSPRVVPVEVPAQDPSVESNKGVHLGQNSKKDYLSDIPISALPPKKRYMRQIRLTQASEAKKRNILQQQLTQASEARPPTVVVAAPGQVPLTGSNKGASLGQKNNHDNSLGPINWRSTRWWNYQKRSLDDADNAEKNDAINSQNVGNATAGKRNRVKWGHGLAKYEKEKREKSNDLPVDGDNADIDNSSENMTQLWIAQPPCMHLHLEATSHQVKH
uniref:Uncharacterized protein n=1 Tax=Leersia perrieri TaxID=77586 RepID=A0A0D9XRL4_9ORYZ